MPVVSRFSAFVEAWIHFGSDFTAPVIRLIEIVRDGAGKVYFRTRVED